MPTVVLLGPQRYQPTLAEAFDRVQPTGPVAAVTAGWEDREDEIDELTEHLGRDVINLQLHQRCEQVFARDAEFLEAWRVRRLRLRRCRELYRQRLGDLVRSVHALERRRHDDLVQADWEDSLRIIRELDDRQLRRVTEIHDEFEERMRPQEREAVVVQHERIAELISGCGSITFAGGHVAVLRNRLRLFDIAGLIEERPLFAWSAGAMCATERIVIYHDSAPLSSGHPQVLEAGLGLCPGIVALPHASRRLHLSDVRRVRRFAARFAPQTCIALDDASGMIWDGSEWDLLGDGARRLRGSGQVTEVQLVEGAA